MPSSSRGRRSFLHSLIHFGVFLATAASNNNSSSECLQGQLINFEKSGQVKEAPGSTIPPGFHHRVKGISLARKLVPPKKSGPTVDHTTGTDQGYYLPFYGFNCNETYTPLSGFDSVAIYQPPAGAICSIEFWYSLEGDDAGCLDVQVIEIIQTMTVIDDVKSVWKECGNQGTGRHWKKGTVNNITSPYSIRLRFDMYCNISAGRKRHGDVAIDDVQFTCRCPVATVSPPTSILTPSVSPLPPTHPISPTSRAAVSQPTTDAATAMMKTTEVIMVTNNRTSMSTAKSTFPAPRATSQTGASTVPISVTTLPAQTSLSTRTLQTQPTSQGTTEQGVASSGGGGGGFPAAIIAGVAAGLLLLLIIILIIIYKRRHSNEASLKEGGRTGRRFDNPNYSGGCYPNHLRNSPTSETTTVTQQTTSDHSNDGAEPKVVAMTRKNPYYEHKYLSGERQRDSQAAVGDLNDADAYDDTRAQTYDEPDTLQLETNYDDPEAICIEYEEIYDDEAPKYTAPSKVVTSPTAIKTGYDHLQHDDIAEEVYSRPYCEPGTTTRAVYRQLAGQAYRHLARAHVTLKDELGSGYLKTAVKLTKADASADVRLKLLQEAAIMGQFRHKNVVQLYGVVCDDEASADEMDVWLVLELMVEDLKTRLVNLRTKWTKKSSKKELFRMCHDIAEGMAYLSMRGFVHRDLAARNVMLDGEGACKIGDFGMSRDLEENDFYKSAGGVIPVKWSAPEAIHYRKFSQASDVWSYGVVLYEIFTLGRKPYAGWYNEDVAREVCAGYRLEQPDACPDGLYQLMLQCWLHEKDDRPTFDAILEHLVEIMPTDGHQREVDAAIKEETCGGRIRRLRATPKRRSVVSDV